LTSHGDLIMSLTLADFLLANTPRLSVRSEAVSQIVATFDDWPLEKGEYLLKAGKRSGYYVLLDGHMRAFTVDNAGQEVTTAFYTGPGVVIEAASFYQQLPAEEAIVALTRCRGYFTTFDKLNDLFHAVPEFREFGRAMLVREFVAYKGRMLAMINKTAQERYERLMESNKDIIQVAQLRHIASYLGITDSSLSRIRKNVARKAA
jgi:CRP-like cAMP-binding protein